MLASTNSNPLIAEHAQWATEVEACVAWATRAGRSEMESELVNRSIETWRENVIDYEIQVSDARKRLDDAVNDFQRLVRERGRAAQHLAHLEHIGDENRSENKIENHKE